MASPRSAAARDMLPRQLPFHGVAGIDQRLGEAAPTEVNYDTTTSGRGEDFSEDEEEESACEFFLVEEALQNIWGLTPLATISEVDQDDNGGDASITPNGKVHAGAHWEPRPASNLVPDICMAAVDMDSDMGLSNVRQLVIDEDDMPPSRGEAHKDFTPTTALDATTLIPLQD
eukprot:5052186-Pyramimonas_sp.AAC.1